MSTPKEVRALRRRVIARPEKHHPVVAGFALAHKESLSIRISDAITRFAGSMSFVYMHAALFTVWCISGLFGLDPYPFNFLTMTVSLEAIFLSTFVMIGQNRSAAFAQAKAEHDFQTEQQELHENTQLTREIHSLATSVEFLVRQLTTARKALEDVSRKDMPPLRQEDPPVFDGPPQMATRGDRTTVVRSSVDG